jgi:ADP-ribosyl-[dinitrogen reductase] hydrolase
VLVLSRQERYRGCLLGLAAGDAVGSSVGSRSRGEFPPVTGPVGGGPLGLARGQWTDATAMALCLGESLLERGGFDAADQMDRYVRWWREDHWSATGAHSCIGVTTRAALERYIETGDPLTRPISPRSAGNRCIARLAPAALFYGVEREASVRFSGLSARTTHGVRECIDACRLMGDVLWLALSGASKDRVLTDHTKKLLKEPRVQAVARGAWRRKAQAEIRSSGYVVDCLEAALWAFGTTDSFEAAVLRAANLGDDAGATAAVCGQVAGAHYGVRGVPAGWLGALAMRRRIERMADSLLAMSRTAVRRRHPALEEAMAAAS